MVIINSIREYNALKLFYGNQAGFKNKNIFS